MREQGEYVDLASGQPRERGGRTLGGAPRRLRQDRCGDLLAEHHLAAGDSLERASDVVRLGALDHIASRTGTGRGCEHRRVLTHRQHQDRGRRLHGPEPAECGVTIHAREGQIEHHHVGPLLCRRGQGRLRVRVAADDLEAGQTAHE